MFKSKRWYPSSSFSWTWEGEGKGVISWDSGNLVTICQKMTRFPFSSFLIKSIFITWLTEEGKGKEQLTTIITTTGKTFSKRHQHNFMIDTHDEGWAQPLPQKDSRSPLFLVGTLWVQLCGELQPFNQVKDSFLNSENKLKRGSPKDIKSGGIKSKSLLGTKAVSLARIKNIILLIGCWWPERG